MVDRLLLSCGMWRRAPHQRRGRLNHTATATQRAPPPGGGTLPLPSARLVRAGSARGITVTQQPRRDAPPESGPGEPSRPGVVVMVCAWCERNERTAGAARGPDSGEWVEVSHAAAQAFKRAGFASHAICPACLGRIAREWGFKP